MSIKEKIVQYGIFNSISRFFKIVLRKLGIRYERYIFYTQKIDVGRIVFNRISDDFIVKELCLDDFLNSDYYNYGPTKLELYKKRFNNSNFKSYGILIKNRLIFSCWISLKDFEMSVPSCITLDNNQGLFLDSYCLSDYRGRGLHTYMNNYRLKKIKEFGKDFAVAIVLFENIPSRKSQEKVGFEKYKEIIYCSIFSKEIIKII